MTYFEIDQIVKELDIDHDKESLTYKAAVILLYGIANNTTCTQRIKRGTGYWWKEVAFVINNFWANGIIKSYNWQLHLGGDELQNVIEIACIAMCGAGNLKAYGVAPDGNEIAYTWEEYIGLNSKCIKTNVKKHAPEIPQP